MTRILLAALLAALLSGCAGEVALLRCARAQHDINRRCQ
jgi:hypothetical protein